MDALRLDLRYAIRGLFKSPGFTLIVVLTLALGIGANTAIFSLMDQVLMRLLPVRDPGRLVVLDAPGPTEGTTHNNSDTRTPISHPTYLELRDGSPVFDGLLAHWPAPVHLGARGRTEEAKADLVSGNYFDVLGLLPAAGRLLTPEDDRVAGGHPVVVLGHGYWARRFGSDPAIVGGSVLLNGKPMEVVGVAPAGFKGVEIGDSIDLYVPLAMQPIAIPTWKEDTLTSRRVMWLTPIARLRPGVSLEEATAGVNVVYHRILEEDIDGMKGASSAFREEFLQKKLVLLPAARGTSELRTHARVALLVLMAMVGLVLLIACANVANLLLARATSRRKEVAIRLALGAGRARLVRQFLVESVLLSVLGAAAGLVVSAWTTDLLLGAIPDASAANAFSANPDLRVALFAFSLSLVTGVLFGLVPALQSTRPDLFPTLKSESGSLMGGAGPLRFRKGLVVAQVGLSLLLLIGAGLFTRSLGKLMAIDPGFDEDNLLAFTVDPSLNGYDELRRSALYDGIRSQIAAEPGVRSVSMSEIGLMTGDGASSNFSAEGHDSIEGESNSSSHVGVGAGYFRTLGIPLLSGRGVAESDAATAPKVAVVNEAFARKFFGGRNPVGFRMAFGKTTKLDIEIIGLVQDGLTRSMRETPMPFAYLPIAQESNVGEMTFYVRHAGSAEALPGRLRTIVASIDPGLPLTNLKTMRTQVRESLLLEQVEAFLSGAFGLLATLLAGLGLYGVMSYAVTLRRREIGIRIALGAERSHVLALVLKEVAVLTAAGVALGLAGGYGLGRVIESQLYGMTSNDPLSFGLATAILLGAALLAGYVPAMRASRVDPITALRTD